MSAATSPRFDHVVVIMFENRAFDHLLGSLYTPAERPEFEGVLGRALSNPIPAGTPGAERGVVPVHPASDMDTPDPDPGEEFPHVNTQLFGTVDPPENRFRSVEDMAPPFNAPADPAATPTMSGFVADYVHNFHATIGRAPTPAEYDAILAVYRPEQVPVLASLARGFAVFDRWFCDVPSQTFTNRSFFHAGTSSGFVLNAGGNFPLRNDPPTIFERLEAAHLRWKVYIDPLQVVSVTGLLHARRLAPFFATHFATLYDFYEDARQGELPEYAFLEPNLLHPHTDMHPPGFGRVREALHLRAPSSILQGEALLADVYEAIRASATPTGSNALNTLLLVTFDEHGGTFDHVPPPRVPPPDPAAPAGQMGFRFDRAGVRIPTIAISAWIDPGTVVGEEFWGTSVVRTLRGRWSLGDPLTGRDAAARDLAPVLARTNPRDPSDWPRPIARPIPIVEKVEALFELPLAALGRAIVGSAFAHEAATTSAPVDGDPDRLTRREASRRLRELTAAAFPGVRDGRQR